MRILPAFLLPVKLEAKSQHSQQYFYLLKRATLPRPSVRKRVKENNRLEAYDVGRRLVLRSAHGCFQTQTLDAEAAHAASDFGGEMRSRLHLQDFSSMFKRMPPKNECSFTPISQKERNNNSFLSRQDRTTRYRLSQQSVKKPLCLQM